MSFSPRTKIPGLDPEASRALVEVQTAIARECQRLEERIARPKRRCTDLVEAGTVEARPGEVVRVQPGDDDVTVLLPEPSAESDGQDIIVSFEGDGTAAGKVNVTPKNGTCAKPGVVVLNAPGSYSFTSTGGGAVAKRANPAVPTGAGTGGAGTGGGSGSGWSGPAPITTDDLPPIDTDELEDDAVTNAKLDEMAANSVKVNATGSPANPTDLVIAPLSLLGRSAGDIDDITAPATVDGQALYMRTNAAGTAIAWQTMSEASMPRITDSFFFANMSGVSPGQVLAKSLANMAGPGLRWSTASVGDYKYVVQGSASIIVGVDGGDDDVQRAALTGDVTAAQNSNATTIANDAVTNAKLANMAAGTVKGRQIDAGTGDPVDLTGAEVGENIQFSTIVVDTTATGTVTAYSFPEPSNALVFQNLTVIVQGIVARPSGTLIWLRHTGTGSTTLVHQSGSAVSADTISTGGVDIVLTNTMQALLLYTNGRWRVYGVSHGTRPALTGAISAAANVYATLFAGIRDNGSAENDRTNLNFLSTTSVISVVADDSVGDELEITHERAALTGDVTAAQNVNTTAFRNFSAVSVLGRAANSTGAPADIAAGANNRVLCRHSDALSFDQIVNADITDGTIALGKLAGIGANTLVGNPTASSAVPSEIGVGTNTVLGRVGANIVAAQLVTAQITDDNVTDGKLRNSAAVSVIGRSANSSGDPADIAAGANDRLLARTGDALSFQQLTVGMVPDGVLTLAKQADLAQSRIIGRAELAGTGVPQALTPAQVVAIVDAENVAWTGVHSFTSTTFDVNTSADARIGATSGVGLYAATTPGAVATGHVVVNATAGFGVVIDAAAAGVSSGGAGFCTFSATSDMWMSTTAGGIALSTEAAHPTGVTNGLILLDSVGNVQLDPAVALVINTNGVQRLTIESDGSWNVGGSNGTTGLTLVSAGSAAPPTWAQLPTAGIADAAVTLAKQANLAQSTIIGRAEGAGTGVPTALTPTQVVAIIDGESPVWSASHQFDSYIQFGTSTGLPGLGDIRKAGALTIQGAADVTVIGSNVSLTATNFVELRGATRVNDELIIGSPTAVSTPATVQDLALGNASAIRITGATVTAIGGIVGSGVTGHVVFIINAGSNIVSLNREDAGSTASARFAGTGGSAILVRPGEMQIGIYDASSARWRALSGVT